MQVANCLSLLFLRSVVLIPEEFSSHRHAALTPQQAPQNRDLLVWYVYNSSAPIFANSTVYGITRHINKACQEISRHTKTQSAYKWQLGDRSFLKLVTGCTCLQPSQDKEKGKDSAVVLQLAKTKMCSSQPANAGSDG